MWCGAPAISQASAEVASEGRGSQTAHATGSFTHAVDMLGRAHSLSPGLPDPELHYLRGEALIVLLFSAGNAIGALTGRTKATTNPWLAGPSPTRRLEPDRLRERIGLTGDMWFAGLHGLEIEGFAQPPTAMMGHHRPECVDRDGEALRSGTARPHPPA